MKIKGNSGFSLFELVVFIISVAIIYAYAANRFSEFPAQAERANFTAIFTQLQSGITLESMFGGNGGIIQDPSILEGINPMDLLLSTPSNYLGAFDVADEDEMSRRSWYFDKTRNELVYLVNDVGGVYLEINGTLIPTDSLHFKVKAMYREIDAATGLDAAIANRTSPSYSKDASGRFSGMLLQPVIPFVWGEEVEEELMSSALASTSP